MARIARTALAIVVAALVFAGGAQAAGGNYVFDGGTPKQQAQVRAALNVSSFDWNVVPAPITIHIRPGSDTYAIRGQIWLDGELLDSGTYSWGVVQHEYAHQVDFFLLDDAKRALLGGKLGGSVWWPMMETQHGDATAERFASTLAWAYWPSKQNSLKPRSKRDESAAMAPKPFRSLLSQLLQ